MAQIGTLFYSHASSAVLKNKKRYWKCIASVFHMQQMFELAGQDGFMTGASGALMPPKSTKKKSSLKSLLNSCSETVCPSNVQLLVAKREQEVRQQLDVTM